MFCVSVETAAMERGKSGLMHAWLALAALASGFAGLWCCDIEVMSSASVDFLGHTGLCQFLIRYINTTTILIACIVIRYSEILKKETKCVLVP